ncbi:AAA family ATPase [Orrella daihaiensis]|uniref:AAA family ATPase n=1 Tax=Orrella daihaiensis TaxID=2782176 RepID=A0ABY4AJW6_9BURK|nr:bifunctional aminoglycoside phosphotransferase/ATP-binding protein [Orrella daihaiensis]UOD49685.1 AAA family ATPase [Orrella daihaiensis]
MTLDPLEHDKLVKNLAAHLCKKTGKPARIYRTHISSVITCGKYAYKLKRPVKLSFVDFSTPALRHADCQRELRLNQRTAPALYLDTVRITGTIQKPRISGSGPILDWAVKMRRFKQSDLLSHLIRAGNITTQMAQDLGEHLAKFTNALPSLKLQTVQAHRPTIDWLLQSLEEISTIFPSERRVADVIAKWAKDQARNHQRLIKQRLQQGFYRNCHGDTHLGNLVKLGKDVVAFDALEFNRELSQIDVINDIAFAFMDIIAHDRADLAWSLVNQWCEHTGDYGGLPLLRYYTVYRAIVRAKVAALACRQTHTKTFDRYWGLANRLVAPANPPHLLLVGGLSGSGKSTVSKELVSVLSGIQLRADVIRKQLFASHLNNPKVLYSRQASQKTYAKLANITDTLLLQSMTVIIDATFLSQPHIDLFNKLAGKHRIKLATVWCEAPVAVLRRRIQKRSRQGFDPSDATIKVLAQQIERLKTEPLTWPNQPYRLSTDGPRRYVTCQIHRIWTTLIKKQ